MLPNVCSNNCNPEANRPQQIMIPLFDKLCTNMVDVEGCPSNLTPLYGTTIPDFTLVMPALGLSTDVNICQSQVLVGMWIYFLNFGTFLVTAVNSNGKRITIKNGCANGAAIPGNAVPTSQVTGQLVFYVVSPPACDLGFDESVKDAWSRQSALNLWCISNPPQLSDNEEGWIAVLSAACDPGDCPALPDPNCFKLNKFIKTGKDTIIVPEGWKTITPATAEDGCKMLGPLAETKDHEIVRPIGAVLAFPVNQLLRETTATNSVDYSTLTFSDSVAAYVPACAKYVRLRGYLYMFVETFEDKGVRGNLYVHGAGQSANDPNLKVAYIEADISENVEFSMAWTKDFVPITEADQVVHHTFQILNSESTDNRITYGWYLEAYYL